MGAFPSSLLCRKGLEERQEERLPYQKTKEKEGDEGSSSIVLSYDSYIIIHC